MKKMNPWAVTRDPKLLRRMGKLLEELGEASSVASRVIIQGIEEIDPSSGQANRRRLVDELADVQAQIDETRELLAIDVGYFEARVARKRSNMQEWEALVEAVPA